MEYPTVTDSDRSKVPNPLPLLCTHSAAVGPNNRDKWALTAHYKASRLSCALCVLKEGEGRATQRETHNDVRACSGSPYYHWQHLLSHFGKCKSIKFFFRIKCADWSYFNVCSEASKVLLTCLVANDHSWNTYVQGNEKYMTAK